MVGIVLLILYAFDPTGNYDGITAFVQVIIGLIVIPLLARVPRLRSLPRKARVMIGSGVTLGVLLLLPPIATSIRMYQQSQPARAARAIGGDWPIIIRRETFENPSASINLQLLDDKFATGTRRLENGRLVFNMTSRMPATSFVELKTPPLRDFFITVTITKLSGPMDSSCGIIFGREAEELWLFYRVRADKTISVSRDPGYVPHIQVSGPIKVDAIKPYEPNTLMILSHNGRYQLFLNDVEVYTISDPTIPAGELDLAMQALQGSTAVGCAFDDLEIRAP